MADWWHGDPSEQPAWEENMEVLNYIETEDRDPRLIQLQQLWVYLEMHKRERVNYPDTADRVLKDAKALYENIVTNHPHFPPHLRSRLDDLKRELDVLLPR